MTEILQEMREILSNLSPLQAAVCFAGLLSIVGVGVASYKSAVGGGDNYVATGSQGEGSGFSLRSILVTIVGACFIYSFIGETTSFAMMMIKVAVGVVIWWVIAAILF